MKSKMKRIFSMVLSLVVIFSVLSESTVSVHAATTSGSIFYKTHCQNIGWTGYSYNSVISGTIGQSLRMEAIEIKVSGVSGGVTYRTHVQNIGWQAWKQNGETAGTTGQSLQIEAIEIKLTGTIANHYDVMYRTHVQNIGWQDWKKNGETAGTTGQSLRVEAIEIKLVSKSSSSTTSSNSTYMQKVNEFLNTSNYKHNASWSASKRPIKSTYNGTGCCAYAADFVKTVFGKNSPRSGTAFYNPSEIKAGDVLVITGTAHWIVVISRDGNSLKTAEGNWGGKVVVSEGTYTVNNGVLCRNGSPFRTFSVGYHYQ